MFLTAMVSLLNSSCWYRGGEVDITSTRVLKDPYTLTGMRSQFSTVFTVINVAGNAIVLCVVCGFYITGSTCTCIVVHHVGLINLCLDTLTHCTYPTPTPPPHTSPLHTPLTHTHKNTYAHTHTPTTHPLGLLSPADPQCKGFRHLLCYKLPQHPGQRPTGLQPQEQR